MSRISASNFGFLALASLVVIATAGGLAFLWPAAISAGQWQAKQLIKEGIANPQESFVNFTLAAHLDPTNQAAQLGLAKAQLAANQPTSALNHLNQAGGTQEVHRLRIRILLELGRAADATPTVQTLLRNPEPPASDIVMAGLCYALAGRSTDIPALETLPSSPEALRSLKRAKAGKVPLAAELYANGLPESSRALLASQPPSLERNLLLAQIAYAQATPGQLAAATDYLTVAIAIDPSSLRARQLLLQTYQARGLTAEASTQAHQIQRLKSDQ